MTIQQLIHIERQLAEWRKERHLTIESQEVGLVSNVLEELTEFSRATNVDEMVDALCDITVFYLNSIGSIREKENIEFKPVSSIMFDQVAIFKNVAQKQEISYLLARGIIDNLFNYNQMNLLILVNNYLARLGYDYFKCMNETIKEISSRTGHYDETIGKFVKDTSDEAQAKWYKANYSLCKA